MNLDQDSTLTDNLGNSYRPVSFGFSAIPEKQTVSESIYPGKSVTDHLVFELPVNAAESLTLSMPASRAGGTKGTIRFKIPVSAIRNES